MNNTDWIEKLEDKFCVMFERAGSIEGARNGEYWANEMEDFIQELIDKALQGQRERLSNWIDGNVGVSSEAIYLYMTTGKVPRAFDAPSDSGDRGRCITLLKAVPEWTPRLKEIEDLNLKCTSLLCPQNEHYPWNEQIPMILAELTKEDE